jgi:hypothetical protein
VCIAKKIGIMQKSQGNFIMQPRLAAVPATQKCTSGIKKMASLFRHNMLHEVIHAASPSTRSLL